MSSSNEGDWSEDDYWFIGGCGVTAANRLPDANDPGEQIDVVICEDQICHLDVDDDIDTIEVETGALLDVQSGNKLELKTPANSVMTSTFSDSVDLTGTIKVWWEGGANLSGLHTFAGTGEIEGKVDSAEIEIQNDGKLRVSTTIHRALQMEIPDEDKPYGVAGGLILKGGMLNADLANGVLRVAPRTFEDEGTSLSHMKVTHSLATLQYVQDCTGITDCTIACLNYTRIEVMSGLLDLDSPISTRERVIVQSGGEVDFASGVYTTLHKRDACP